MSNESKAVPDYESECELCGNSPVVLIIEEQAGSEHETLMCGPCFFGAACCLHPENW